MCLAGFTLLVAVGVMMEILVLQEDHNEEIEGWHLCKLIPNKPSLRKLGLEIVSILLVTIGILGELGVGLWVSHINGQLRIKTEELRGESDQLIVLVTQQVGDANGMAIASRQAVAQAQTIIRTLEGEVAALSPRTLSPKQQLDIGEALKKFWVIPSSLLNRMEWTARERRLRAR